MFFEKEGAATTTYSHEEIEHTKRVTLNIFRDSPKAKKLQEYQVFVNGATKLMAPTYKDQLLQSGAQELLKQWN